MDKPDSMVVTLSSGWSFPLFGLETGPFSYESFSNNLAIQTIQAFRGGRRELVGIDTGLWTLPARWLTALGSPIEFVSTWISRRQRECQFLELVEVPGCVRVNSIVDVLKHPSS